MKPFREYELRNVLGNQYKAINEKIDKLSNEAVMANDLDVLTDNLYQEFYIEPVTVEEEDFEKRSIVQGKIRKYLLYFNGGISFSQQAGGGNCHGNGICMD